MRGVSFAGRVVALLWLVVAELDVRWQHLLCRRFLSSAVRDRCRIASVLCCRVFYLSVVVCVRGMFSVFVCV